MPLINPGYFINESRGTLVEIHISDLHFDMGPISPVVEYNILEDQFLNKIANVQFDILSIDGDLFDHKLMSNSDGVLYAIKFVDRVINMCRSKNATCIIIHGTSSHDANQLKLFYHYLEDPTIDLRIVEHLQFEIVKGAKILCIPEEYGKGSEYYRQKLLYEGEYDSVFMHGTIVGSVYGADKEDLDSPKYPIFSIDSFAACRGPIIAGHVHDAGCFNTYMYYCSSPMRYRFGEEADKGFIVLFHNLDSGEHYVHFQKIESFRYDTINLDHMSNSDPKEVIVYLKRLLEQGIDNIRVQFTNYSMENLAILNSFYRTNGNIKIDAKCEDSKRTEALKVNEDMVEKYKKMDFLLDPSLNEYEKFVRFVNFNEGNEFITIPSLMKLLEEN